VLPVSGEALDGTLVLAVGYDGSAFSGFAAQPGRRTVAGELVRALETLLRREVDLTCAGRTDSGVHALGQVVSVPVTRAELALPGRRVMGSLTALVPDDVSIRGAYRAAPGFSARFDALSRTYRYRISNGPVRPVMAWDWSWWVRRPLDLDAMRAGARLFLGEHDFASLCKAESAVGKPTCRNVMACDVRETEEYGEPLVAIDVRGNAFLHSMVRTMAGTLVEVGAGRREPSWVGEVIEARDRSCAGPCAPAKGLAFMRVEYAPGTLEPWEVSSSDR
jgi:tRNA pseudouridine38-40 synthase